MLRKLSPEFLRGWRGYSGSGLRKNFQGKPEYIERFFPLPAQDLREVMAELGFRTVDEMTGRMDVLDFQPGRLKNKSTMLDLKPLLSAPAPPAAIIKTLDRRFWSFFPGNHQDIR
jgi:hypothetical protein